jgi:hypothetical protein
MKKEMLLEVYADETNFAVIRIPQRRYPGVLIQGDNLWGLIGDAKEVLQLIDTNKEDAKDALTYLIASLEGRAEDYQKALEGIEF